MVIVKMRNAEVKCGMKIVDNGCGMVGKMQNVERQSSDCILWNHDTWQIADESVRCAGSCWLCYTQ